MEIPVQDSRTPAKRRSAAYRQSTPRRQLLGRIPAAAYLVSPPPVITTNLWRHWRNRRRRNKRIPSWA